MTEYRCHHCHQKVMTNVPNKACYDCGRPLQRKENVRKQVFTIKSTGGVADVELVFKIEICDKYRVNGGKFNGIVLTQGGQVIREPIYPFAEVEDLEALEEFVTTFKEELLKYCQTCSPIGFAHHLFPFNTEKKEAFRNYWFQKGVVVYQLITNNNQKNHITNGYTGDSMV